jgi:putative ABC transport system permease protein
VVRGLSALDRKLLRDLALIRGQAIAIALVIGAGVALFVLMLSAFDSLDLTQRTYYDRYRFAHVFASLKRAPLRLERDLSQIPGVARDETRVVADVNLDVPGLVRPAVGRLISIPERRRAILCDIYLRSGRYIDPRHPDEVLVNEGFARANHLRPGSTVHAVINGRRRELRIVGIALSPEYIYTIRPGEMVTDNQLFGIFWMGRRALGSAFNMEGAFNDVVLTLSHGAPTDEVIARLDDLLEPYGGLGATPRSLQPSHFYLQSELDGLKGMGAVVPVVFLAVAAFLLNVVLTRIVAVQREQIAALKALGYSNRAVGLHYVKWSLVIGLAGAAVGIALGGWMGRGMTRLYADFFHFPILEYRLAADLIARAVLVSIAASVVGALVAVRNVVRLAPAEAMRPEPPARYSVSWVERSVLRRWLSQPARIVLRNLQRRPVRAGLSVVGIAFAGALLIVGTFSMDSVDAMIDAQFHVAQRYDAMLTFVEPVSARAFHEVEHLPGVVAAEPYRALPVRLRFENRSRNTAITGLPGEARLNRVVDSSLRPVSLPPDGLVLSAKLAELLGVSRGDSVTVEVLTETRPVRQVTVAAVVDETMGTNAYMHLEAVRRLMQEGETLSGAYVQVDESQVGRLYEAIKATPAIAGATLKGAAIESMEETIAEMFAMVRTVTVLFAAIIAFGVVYNSARISLSERGRELATLRVIGFRRFEIATILLGELAIVTLVAIPLGCLLGYLLAAGVVQMYDTEVYRMPLVVSSRTFALSAVTVAVSALLSALAVRRRLQRLDLIAVLKTRE